MARIILLFSATDDIASSVFRQFIRKISRILDNFYFFNPGTAHKNVFRCSYLKSKIGTSVANVQDYSKIVYLEGEGGQCIYFVDEGNNCGGTLILIKV